jgi:hypothetical protein
MPHTDWERLLARLTDAERERNVAELRVLRVPANTPPWRDTGVRVARGEELTILARGQVVVSAELGLSSRPRYALWARVAGRGPIWSGQADTQTLRAPHDGPLELAVYQGEWSSRDGALATPPEAYAALSGELEVVILRWRAGARAGLEALRRVAREEPLVAAELARLAAPVEPPPGWEYLWFLGQSETYRAIDVDGRPGIAANLSDDVAILRRPVELALTPDTEIAWRWRVHELPSQKSEDQLLQHDYLSLAVEFENGRDLSYFWSACLPPETHFACPIPQWTPRETHLVARSGPGGLGVWQRERRVLAADYARAIGAPPARVVAIWLIAVALFQHGEGAAEFCDIELASGGRRLEIA